jgi:hypothetical protein
MPARPGYPPSRRPDRPCPPPRSFWPRDHVPDAARRSRHAWQRGGCRYDLFRARGRRARAARRRVSGARRCAIRCAPVATAHRRGATARVPPLRRPARCRTPGVAAAAKGCSARWPESPDQATKLAARPHPCPPRRLPRAHDPAWPGTVHRAWQGWPGRSPKGCVSTRCRRRGP